MATWEKYEASGVAIFPYDAQVAGHLKILGGDQLKITQKCGDWYLAKCSQTCCVGICPANRVLILSEEGGEDFDLLIFEAKKLFADAFHKQLGYPNEKDMSILTQLNKSISMLPLNAENRQPFAQGLDKIRSYLTTNEGTPYPIVRRNKDFSILRTHDITHNEIADTSQKMDSGDSIYPKLVTFHVAFTMKCKEEIKLVFRVVRWVKENNKEKAVEVSAPFDLIIPPNCEEEQVVHFMNMDPLKTENTGLVIRALYSRQFGTGKSNLWASEYAGVASGPLKIAKDGEEMYLTFPFYTFPEGSPLEIPQLVRQQSKSVFITYDIPSLIAKVWTTEERTPPYSPCTEEKKVSVYNYPGVIDPSYTANSYFLRIHQLLNNKTKLKRTRVVVKLLSISERRFLPVFKHTKDPMEFASAVQRGFTDMEVDEVIEVDLNGLDNQLLVCQFVFEIQRVSKSKGDIHLSSYAIVPIANKGVLMQYGDRESKITLMKPTQPVMLAEDYVNAWTLEAGRAATQEDGKQSNGPSKDSSVLRVTSLVHSTVITCNEAIYTVLNWESEECMQKLISDNNSIIVKIWQENDAVICAFCGRMLRSIAGMLNHSNEALTKSAVNCFIKIVTKFDQGGKVCRHYYEEVKAMEFATEDTRVGKWYANMYNPLFDFLAGVLPADKDTDFTDDQMKICKDCCRLLGYFLGLISSSLVLNKKMSNDFDEERFKKYVGLIFSRLTILMTSGKDTYAHARSFGCKSIGLLSDVIREFFDEAEGTDLLVKFIKSLMECDAKIEETCYLHLVKGICDSQFFHSEGNLEALAPLMIKILEGLEIKDLNPGRSSTFIDSIRSLFLTMKRHAKSFREEVAGLMPFIPKLMTHGDNEFVVLLLYFSDIQAVEKLILQYPNPEWLFNTLIKRVQECASANTPPWLFFITTSTFITLVGLSQKPEFSFAHGEMDKLIGKLSDFYNSFLEVFTKMPPADRELYQRVYVVDIEPIAALLPSLLQAVPVASRFNPDAFVPLFHFYVNQEDAQTRSSVNDGFFLLIDADYAQKGNFSRSENAIIHAMDRVSAETGDKISELRELFAKTLERFGARKNATIESFLKKLSQLVGFMHDINKFPNERRYEDERATAIISVLDSCRMNNDFLLFPHFTSKLYELHAIMENKTEAAETLVMAASIFKWDETSLVAKGHGFGEQPRKERKRRILHAAVELFMNSEFYERALDVLAELKEYYSKIDIDYDELAGVYKKEDICWKRVCNQERPILNRFYGVRFYGQKFSSYYRDSLYIYRRNGFFMNDQMMHDLKDRFPDARIDPKPPSEEDLKDPEVMYIHVFNIKPKVVEKFNPYTPPSELMVGQCCNFTEFYSEAPIRKRREGNYGEFAEWHRHIYHYTTSHELQGSVRRAKVVKTSELIELSPIECAVIDTNAKTIELMQKACMYWRCLRYDIPYTQAAVSSFSMLMSGIVNAAVNGGTKVFQDLFLESDLKDEPINQKFGPSLKTAFADQLKAVNFALKIHEQVVDNLYVPLHNNIQTNFLEMKKVMEPAIGVVDLDEQPAFGEIPDTSFLEESSTLVAMLAGGPF